ncbi:hypothetical protein BH23VER1_BH23VER1_32150 [soil metagenome]
MIQTHMVRVACPTCFEQFDVTAPSLNELPCDVDYDCEVCCFPMRIIFHDEGDGEVSSESHGLSE